MLAILQHFSRYLLIGPKIKKKLFLSALVKQRKEKAKLEKVRLQYIEDVQKRYDTDYANTLDELYADLEDAFRGTTKEVLEKLNYYVPVINEIYYKHDGAPILDIGCGRGEWLSILQQLNMNAKGIDNNQAMIQRCLKQGFTVIQDDMLSYLYQQPDNSFSVVTAFQVIEHLPFKTLVILIQEILRTLRPGGIAILETPNPKNIIITSYIFNLDPTHLKPVPPDLMHFLFKKFGFSGVDIREINPAVMPQGLGRLHEDFIKSYYGPRDYAVIGLKEVSL